jgi:hypothetical protein
MTMQYFALLISKERDLTPNERGDAMTAYQDFHAKAGSAIRAGDALTPAATGVRISGGPGAPAVTDGPFAEGSEPHPVRDDELRMMFTCAHPSLDRVSQLALTLRLVSGLTVTEIARALLQTEVAVGQRITRAKNKIRHANIPLRVPPAELLPERTPHVLSCIYSVFTEGYWSTAGPSAIRDELCDE